VRGERRSRAEPWRRASSQHEARRRERARR
jgi:hypothetical protein